MFGLSRCRSWLFWLLAAFVLQGVTSVHATSNGPDQKQSLSHAGHVHSHSAVVASAEPGMYADLDAQVWLGDPAVSSASTEPECHSGGSCCPSSIGIAFDVRAFFVPVRSTAHFPELSFHHRSPTLGGLDRPPQSWC